MKQYLLTKGTNILMRGTKTLLTKELSSIRKKLKKKNVIIEYVRGEKILYKDYKSGEICIFEVIEY